MAQIAFLVLKKPSSIENLAQKYKKHQIMCPLPQVSCNLLQVSCNLLQLSCNLAEVSCNLAEVSCNLVGQKFKNFIFPSRMAIRKQFFLYVSYNIVYYRFPSKL